MELDLIRDWVPVNPQIAELKARLEDLFQQLSTETRTLFEEPPTNKAKNVLIHIGIQKLEICETYQILKGHNTKIQIQEDRASG